MAIPPKPPATRKNKTKDCRPASAKAIWHVNNWRAQKSHDIYDPGPWNAGQPPGPRKNGRLRGSSQQGLGSATVGRKFPGSFGAQAMRPEATSEPRIAGHGRLGQAWTFGGRGKLYGEITEFPSGLLQLGVVLLVSYQLVLSFPFRIVRFLWILLRGCPFGSPWKSTRSVFWTSFSFRLRWRANGLSLRGPTKFQLLLECLPIFWGNLGE